ncbi:MAG: homocysteine S-methyltransferase family protein, partial [Candidatus Atribacteria bacterium]|nr:homocysteine S-methyltransferase family protein [Candidatus Atribacteria bacterium]
MIMNKFLSLLKNKIIVFDGAMGTSIQAKKLNPDNFWGKNGCNEILTLSKPSIIQDIHSSFLEVGCDVIETDTFGGSKLVLQEYDLAEKTYALNKRAAEIAREVASDFSTPSHPRFVSGSIGSGNKLPTLGQIDFDTLTASYAVQMEGLVDGKVDMIQIETAQDLLQIKAALWAVFRVFRKKKKHLPVIVQLTMEEKGRTLLGTDMLTALTALELLDIDIIGLNCGTGPQSMNEHVRILSHNSPRYISIIPNAGMPENREGKLVYKLSPEDFTTPLYNYVKDWGVNIVGGCCGTTPRHIKSLVEAVKGLSPGKRIPKFLPSAASLYNIQNFSVTPRPLIIGERTNAQGSKCFRELLQKEDWEEMVEIALEQQREGAHLLDVSVASAGRNEEEDMNKLLFRLNKEIEIPLMIDTTSFIVMGVALKKIGGKAVINSVNFEEGEEKVKKVMALCKKLGAGLVGLAIDEKGMAFSVERKIQIARRFYQLALKEGMDACNLFFDTLTFSLASGDKQYFEAGKDTLEA